MQFSFKAFSFKLAVPGYSQDFKEITIDCVAIKQLNPFGEVDIWTEINAVWCKNVDIYPLLKSELISLYETTGKCNIETIAMQYGERVFSGKKIVGVTELLACVESESAVNIYDKYIHGAKEYQVQVKRVFYQVYIDYSTGIDVKETFFYQELAEILINGQPAQAYGPLIHRDLYDALRDLDHARASNFFMYEDVEREYLNRLLTSKKLELETM